MFIFGYPKLLFWISKVTYLDISNKTSILWQAELTFILFFQISEIIISRYLKKTILDIPKQVRILDIQKSYFGYQKQQFWISENKHLFQISKIFISDIQNNYSGYQELNRSFFTFIFAVLLHFCSC